MSGTTNSYSGAYLEMKTEDVKSISNVMSIFGENLSVFRECMSIFREFKTARTI